MPSRILSKNSYKHRRQKLGLWQLLSFASHICGNQLYYIGATVEREAFNIRRRLFRNTKKVFRATGRFFGNLFTAVLHVLTSFFKDFSVPVWLGIKTLKDIKQIRKATPAEEFALAKAEYYKTERVSHKTQFSRFVNVAAPIAGAGLMVVVVAYVLSMNIALQLNVNGTNVGYVENEGQYNDAKRLLQSRMVTVQDSRWVDSATYTLAVVPDSEMTESNTIVDNILTASGENIVSGTGVFVGGVFLGCTTETEKINSKINTIIDKYQYFVNEKENAVVKFRHNVQLVDGVFPTGTLHDYSYFENMIDGGEQRDLVYSFVAGDNISDIAINNGMTVEALKALNPKVDFNNLVAGTKLTVAQNENIFLVRTLVVETVVESIPYESVIIPDARYSVGYWQVVTRGVVGKNRVTQEIEYQNGVEISRLTVSSETINETVNEQMIIGTKPPDGVSTGSVGTGYLAMPCTAYYYIIRGWIPGDHRGIDFTGAKYTPIYASDNGVVTYAGWHGVGNTGFGNYVAIDHNNSLVTHYAHLESFVVNVGDVVTKGQLIGFMGSTGNSTGYHLHFALTINDVWQNPEPYLFDGKHV